MTTKIDPDVAELMKQATALSTQFKPRGELWAGSPFKWIVDLPIASIGKVGVLLLTRFLLAEGLRVDGCADTDADLIVGGARCEVKFATMSKTNTFTFNQLRPQDYQLALLFGLMPADARLWVVRRDVILSKLRGQHGGGAAKETSISSFPCNAPPPWASGGTLRQGVAALRASLRA